VSALAPFQTYCLLVLLLLLVLAGALLVAIVLGAGMRRVQAWGLCEEEDR
jgi:hypothetical protein